MLIADNPKDSTKVIFSREKSVRLLIYAPITKINRKTNTKAKHILIIHTKRGHSPQLKIRNAQSSIEQELPIISNPWSIWSKNTFDIKNKIIKKIENPNIKQDNKIKQRNHITPREENTIKP